jgi:hypothetical protein
MYLPIEEYLGCLQIFAAINIHVPILVDTSFQLNLVEV